MTKAEIKERAALRKEYANALRTAHLAACLSIFDKNEAAEADRVTARKTLELIGPRLQALGQDLTKIRPEWK
jgi:hypothetical protein